MKKFLLIVSIIAVLSAFTVPTMSRYTSELDHLAQGTITADQMVKPEKCVEFIADYFDEVPDDVWPQKNNSWSVQDKHWNYSLYYYIFKQKLNSTGYFLDSTGQNFGVGATEKMKALSRDDRCVAPGNPTWQIYIYNISSTQKGMTLYITHYDVNEFNANDLIPHVLKIEDIVINLPTSSTRGSIDRSCIPTLRVTCGTVVVAEKTMNGQIYDPQVGALVTPNPSPKIKYFKLNNNTSSFSAITCPVHNAE